MRLLRTERRKIEIMKTAFLASAGGLDSLGIEGVLSMGCFNAARGSGQENLSDNACGENECWDKMWRESCCRWTQLVYTSC